MPNISCSDVMCIDTCPKEARKCQTQYSVRDHTADYTPIYAMWDAAATRAIACVMASDGCGSDLCCRSQARPERPGRGLGTLWKRYIWNYTIPYNPSESLQILRNPSKSFGILQNPSESLKILQNLSKSLKILRNPSKTLKIHQNSLKSVKIP